MKKIIACAFVGICLLAVSVPGKASSEKDLFDYVKEEYNVAEFKPFGVFGGFLKGTFYEFKDFSHETYRFLTYNIEDDKKGGFARLKDISHETYRILTLNMGDDNFLVNMFNNEGDSK